LQHLRDQYRRPEQREAEKKVVGVGDGDGETQAEERVGFNERTATGDNFGTAPRDEIESRELLKNTNGVGGGEP